MRSTPAPDRLLLVASAVVAVLAFAALFRAPLALGLALPLAAGLRVQLRAPAVLVRALRWLSLLALVATGMLAFYARALGLLQDDTSVLAAHVLGYVLAALAAGMALTSLARLRPHIFSATVGLLVVVSFQRSWISLAFVLAGGLILWTWAAAVGGPRRYASALAMMALVGVPLTLAVVWFLPWAQPFVEAGTANAFMAGTSTGISEGATLGTASSLSQSERVMLRAWSARPHHLRAWTYRAFDGRTWSGAIPSPAFASTPTAASLRAFPDWPGEARAIEGLRPDALRGASIETMRVLFADATDVPLVVPARTVLLHVPGAHDATPRLYGVGFLGEGAPTGLFPLPEPPDLDVPALDPRIASLARRLASADAPPRRRVAITLAFLHGSYRYTLTPGRFRTRDPLAEFLFDKREGYCEYFATAAAVLLRLQGVPARYVEGVALGPHNRVGDHYLVRERHAHAWVEAWLPERGWVELDPTPPGDYSAAHPSEAASSLRAFVEALRSRVSLLWARLRGWDPRAIVSILEAAAARARSMFASPWRVVALATTLALLLLTAAARHRRRLRAKPDGAADLPLALLRLHRRAERRLKNLGCARPAHRGLLEHLDALPRGTLGPEEARTLREVAQAYYAARFGARLPPDADLSRLARHLDRALSGRHASQAFD